MAPTDTLTRRIEVARIITRLNIGGPTIHAILLTQALEDERVKRDEARAAAVELKERHTSVGPQQIPSLLGATQRTPSADRRFVR